MVQIKKKEKNLQITKIKIEKKEIQVEKMVEESRRRMKKAAADLDFAAAAKYRDEMWALQQYLKVWKDA